MELIINLVLFAAATRSCRSLAFANFTQSKSLHTYSAPAPRPRLPWPFGSIEMTGDDLTQYCCTVLTLLRFCVVWQPLRAQRLPPSVLPVTVWQDWVPSLYQHTRATSWTPTTTTIPRLSCAPPHLPPPTHLPWYSRRRKTSKLPAPSSSQQ